MLAADLQQALWPVLGPLAQALHAHQHTVCAALGLLLLLAAVRCVCRLARFVYVYWLRPGVDPRSYGDWAVVTGGSEGIGRAYADLLAQRGMDLVLVSLPEPRLHEAAADLAARHGVQVRTVATDLCRVGPELFAQVGEALKGIQVGILVNCAGMFQPHPDYLEAMPDQRLQDMVTLNSLVPTMLCKMVLPGMKAAGRGLIVNIGSATAQTMPEAPMLGVYAATKLYLDSLSRSLDAEARAFGVRVQNQWPMYVATRMPGIKTASLMVPLPETWAAAAVRQIGRETSLTPYWFHAFLHAAVQALPGVARRNNTKVTLEAREKGLRAKAAAAADAVASKMEGGAARAGSPRKRK